jgi:hypothetical protein
VSQWVQVLYSPGTQSDPSEVRPILNQERERLDLVSGTGPEAVSSDLTEVRTHFEPEPGEPPGFDVF